MQFAGTDTLVVNIFLHANRAFWKEFWILSILYRKNFEKQKSKPIYIFSVKHWNLAFCGHLFWAEFKNVVFLCIGKSFFQALLKILTTILSIFRSVYTVREDSLLITDSSLCNNIVVGKKFCTFDWIITATSTGYSIVLGYGFWEWNLIALPLKIIWKPVLKATFPIDVTHSECTPVLRIFRPTARLL